MKELARKSRRGTPCQVVKSRYVTEKTRVLEGLRQAESNRCLRACETPKYVFLVHVMANKREIARAVEWLYRDQNIRVCRVNTIRMKPKKRRVKGYVGYTHHYKKAVVTLEKGDVLEEYGA